MSIEGYISNVECACGCETLMPQHLVNRGWKFLYNHKPKNAPATKREPQHGPVQQIGLNQIMDFAMHNVEMLTDQFEARQRECVQARLACEVLEREIARWKAILENGRMLAGIAESHGAA